MVKMPIKISKNRQLADIQNDEIREISSFHIIVEYAIGGFKKCLIVKERFRYRKFGFDYLVFVIACDLHNLKLQIC